ncbi:hypothetical protein VCV18_009159 [Metarhizium anisopliae]
MQQRFIRAKIEGEDKTWPVLDVAYWIVTGESNAGGNAPPSRGNLPGLKASENRYAQAIIA